MFELAETDNHSESYRVMRRRKKGIESRLFGQRTFSKLAMFLLKRKGRPYGKTTRYERYWLKKVYLAL